VFEHWGMAEVVKDGVNGFLVEEGSVESICDKLLYIERNTEIASNIGQIARTYVEKTILIWSMAARSWFCIRSFSQGVQNIL